MEKIIYPSVTERWDVFEIRIPGKTDGNPFTDCRISGEFSGPSETVRTDGFYDGNGEYVVRFMPDEEGDYRFTIHGDFSDSIPLPVRGSFHVTPAKDGNHGPVDVCDTHHFRYRDGTPYYSLGTTCYAWVHQPEELQEETLRTLRTAPFNKIRFCIFPKHYDYNYAEPLTYPFEGSPCDTADLNRSTMQRFTEEKKGNHWDFTHLSPGHFRRFDRRIRQLMEMGIQADLILFHPYDRWGFDGMGAENDDRYVRYVVARYAACRNVWWSLANEYDYIRSKTREDWERIGALISDTDPFGRLCSVHNGPAFFDFTRPWVTHCSCQGTNRYNSVERTDELLETYRKPVVWDEVLYEGNLDLGWGNITGEELVRRFWEATMRGGYIGHGETLLQDVSDVDHAILWWSHGGSLHGESAPRIAFLRRILEETPGGKGLHMLPGYWDTIAAAPSGDEDGSYRIYYFSYLRPLFRDFYLDDTTDYEVEILDTWRMEIRPQGIFRGHFRIILDGEPYQAVRIRRCVSQPTSVQ
ncbi:MAG: DUF5060 domain-containing protein [Lachnospiraceae bacterium]|nr:DUF5060 domain-containing protein [Lachnospiraceae bacterium]